MAELNVLLSCGNADKTLKIERDCTFDEFRTQVKSLFPHLPEVSKCFFLGSGKAIASTTEWFRGLGLN